MRFPVTARVVSLPLAASLFILSPLVVSPALAGKPERDAADELKPKIETTQGDVKGACGCDVPIKVDWATYTVADHFRMIGYAVDAWSSAAKSYCEKDADKKALCENVTEVDIKFTAEDPSVKYDAKKIAATTGSDSYGPDSWYKDVLNKF